MQVLKGTKSAAYDMVCINAAATLYLSTIAQSLEHGIELVKNSLENGTAYKKLYEFISYN